MSAFFIERPVFAWVLAILTMLAGGLALYGLPIAQYPNIAPPEIFVSCRYPGASAETVDRSVTQIIEQQISGVENLSYISAYSDASGESRITLTFEAGTDPNVAQMQVQNKVQLAMARLPEEVQRQGLRVAKITRNYLVMASLVSEDGSMSREDIADYIAGNIQDIVSRLPGVGDVGLMGSPYAMRIWCDPAKFEQYKLTPSDVIAAVRAQNAQVSAGQLGGLPAAPGQEINLTVNAVSRLETVDQFKKIFLRVEPDGSHLLLGDVARVELAADNPGTVSRMNGKPCATLNVRPETGANALEATKAVKAELDRLARFFPPGLKLYYTYDVTPFIRVAILGVFRTLIEAVVLVFLVIWLFLQNLRATFIPSIAIPVVILGTFAVLSAVGYSINTLTMFGVVLAIGLLVDDAIVVVENVERLMRQEGLSPKEAAKKSMRQISGALVGITSVVAAVFTPMAFFGGSAGVIYRQFAITIIAAMALSLLVALILTPALCAQILKPAPAQPKYAFSRWFGRMLSRNGERYVRAAAGMLARPVRWLLVYGGALALMLFLLARLPTAFLPPEDQGRLSVRVKMPPGASLERTLEAMSRVERYFLDEEGAAVRSVLSNAGRGQGVVGQNSGSMYISLKDWSARRDGRLSARAVQARGRARLGQMTEGQFFVSSPPAVSELGTSSGFDCILLDRAGVGHDALMAARDEILAKARQDPVLRNVRANGLDDVAMYKLHIDLARAGALGVSAAEINTSLAAWWGSSYINDFIHHGRSKRVYFQADAPFRMRGEDFGRYYARNDKGEMVSFASFMSASMSSGSPRLERFNGLPSIQILGEAASGHSTGEAMERMEALVRELPPGIDCAWSGLSFQERETGSRAGLLYALSVTMIFLCLAALYESWRFPFSVMLVAPLGVLGVFAGAWMRGLNNDIYFQVGLLTIIGLAARNAILIVEFAKDQVDRGVDAVEATLAAARLRFRPILMTALSFILGVLPLVLRTGAGSGSQNALGTAVFCGMISASVLGLFYTPLFFVVMYRLRGKGQAAGQGSGEH